MKLSFKIFLGIFIPSMISIFIISYLLINKYTDSVIETESIKSYQIYKDFNNRFNGTLYEDDKIKNQLSSFSKYYDNVDFSFYRDNEKVYSNHQIDITNDKLISVKGGNYNSLVDTYKNNHYLLIAIRNNSNDVFVFYKNINSTYKSINSVTKLCVFVSIGLLIFILAIAYVISKTITKPLKRISKEVTKVAGGDYDINLKEGKDEVGSLAKNINIMSKEIKNRNDDLVSLLDSKQLFIDNLSHEMNTPLTSIYGYVELMQKANLDDEKKYKALDYMKNETKRIMDMQKKLLMLSYKENTTIDKNNINLDNIYEQLNIELSDRLSSKNISISFNNSINNFVGDELLISLAISNLIRNAINNSSNNTSISVTSYTKDNYNYICVKDQGCGIKKEDIDKIVEPFYRVDKARSRKDGGAGLGLSIVKKIMNIHNGELLIESEINVGSTFILKFPL